MAETPAERVIAEDVPEGTPLVPGRIRLRSVDDVRAEMARVYREVRSKKLSAADGARLIYMLTQLARVVEVARIEHRLDDVVRALREAGISYVPKS